MLVNMSLWIGFQCNNIVDNFVINMINAVLTLRNMICCCVALFVCFSYDKLHISQCSFNKNWCNEGPKPETAAHDVSIGHKWITYTETLSLYNVTYT